MKKNSLKLAQKGGMMIEALAMLGLIAVVTPTMYKKSAERTLEVEDINTATTMRSVMTAADSYVSSHYGELIQEISANETNNTSKTLSISDLQPYLPYGFNADKLYDFSAPQVSVVRNGNNLTAFVLFPAKEDAENGLGQERTVRIATLVGANGGYVNGNQTAKGIGGIWNLNKDDFQTVFGSTDEKKPEVYSIVTASTDAINNTNTEEDTDKFLYRTAANGLWHNTMRADLYMGGNPDEHDGYDAGTPKSQPFSIRNIKSLIVGTQNADEQYGLYINGADDGEGNSTNDAAFIKGSLEAVNSQFKVDESQLLYKTTTNDALSVKFSDSGVALYTPHGHSGLKETNNELGKLAHSVDVYGNIENYGYTVELARAWPQEGGEFTVGGKNLEAIKASGWDENTVVSLVGDNIFKVTNVGVNESKDYKDQIVMMNNTTAGKGKGDRNSWNKTISYNNNNSPVFPVRVGSNAQVEGILATAQLDTQDIRAATLDVGSENIDDTDKWLEVDDSGISMGRFVDDKDLSYGNINNSYISFEHMYDNTDTAYLELDSFGINLEHKNTEGDTVSIKLKTDDNSQKGPSYINITSDKIEEKFIDNNITFSSLEDSPTTNVKIQKTNFEVSDENDKRVFAVRGNTNSEDDKLKSTGDFDVAVHGDTVFTPQGVEKAYLTVGNEYADKTDDTGVAISKSSDNNISNAMYIDVGSNSVSRNRPVKNESEGQIKWNMNNTYYAPGTVYVRKGMVEVLPGKPNRNAAGKGLDSATSGNGFISAGRFVANNLDEDGNEVEVPDFVNYGSKETDKEVATYAQYNGAGASNPYDTYMVNPAYTSVMHDIKLTTRGGARLSDILPDFINKGIYVTSNTYPDLPTEMSITINGGDISVGGKKVGETYDGIKFESSNAPINLGAKNSWASPYLGFVPAPQCPPGYNRVITMAPQSFMMAQAGQMQKGTNPREAAYYVKNQVPDDTAFDHYTDTVVQGKAYVQQAFVAPTVSENSEVTTGGTANTQGKKITGANGSTTAEYFLASFGDQTVPLTIQQSTWLKTQAVPVGKKSDSYTIGSKIASDDYVVGWAALMGFVYDAATYAPVMKNLGATLEDNGKIANSGNNIEFNTGNKNVYWNVFPVRRNTLEAYATTYCYFDRKGLLNDLDDNAGKYVDQYDALQDYKTYKTNSWKKIDHNGYLERLNDPTLKYDEVW